MCGLDVDLMRRYAYEMHQNAYGAIHQHYVSYAGALWEGNGPAFYTEYLVMPHGTKTRCALLPLLQYCGGILYLHCSSILLHHDDELAVALSYMHLHIYTCMRYIFIILEAVFITPT